MHEQLMASSEHELFIDDSGRGPAVVLIHGTPSAPDDFRPLVDVLTRSHRVLVPHFPGYGNTLSDASPGVLDRQIGRLEATLARSGIAEAAIVGFSGGAYKAVSIALRGHLGVRRLALLAPAVGFDPPVAQLYRDMVSAIRAGAFDPRPTWLARMASPGFAQRDPAGAARILSWLDTVPTAVVCDELIALADAPDLRAGVARLLCPLLVVTGSCDSAVPPDGSRALAATAPQGAFVPIEGAGHALLVETPEIVGRVLADFLGGQ
jgi:pimeloyl-ACP methyl ester carboxylesterase